MVSRFMAATKHLHAGSAPGAAWDGPEHKAPRAHRPWPRRRAASAGRVSGPVPARRLGAGRGCSSDVGAAAVKDLKTRHATAAPDALPALTTPGGPRAPRAPPPGGGPAHAPPPARGLAVPQTPLVSGVLFGFRRRSADLGVSPGQPGQWTQLASEASPHCGHHLLGLLEPRPCSCLATRYSH